MIAAMTFVPFDATEDEAKAWTVLRPGVPKSMRPALVTWLWKRVKIDGGYVYASRLRDFTNALDIDFNLNDEFTGVLSESQFRKLFANPSDRDLLRLADYLVFLDKYGNSHHGLSELLDDGRSMYHVVEREGRVHRIAPRLPAGVQEAAESVMKAETPAGELLAKAWNNVYELEPNDSAAYAYAVRAVETATFATLGITDANATLGNSIRVIEKADASWRLPFLREHSQYPSKDLLVGTLKSLYKGQRDRHGSEAYSDVTHDEAEGAVLLAVTLVGWFSRKLVVERDPGSFG